MSEQLLARRFAEWGMGLRLDEVPTQVQEEAHRAIVDTIGVIAAGMQHPKVAALAEHFSNEPGSSMLIGYPGVTSAPVAALVNGMAAHVWDFDDTSYTGIMHGSAVVLPAVLAIAQDISASSEDLLAALIVGSEITYTLADICTHRHYFSGWWSTATFSSIGATVGICRLMGLNIEQTVSAIGMTAAAAGVNKTILGTDAKPFMVGEAAQRSITFAKAAAAGLIGPEAAFEHKGGYMHMLNSDVSVMLEANTLGQRWRLRDPGLLFKLNPVCSAAHAAIELMRELLSDAGATAEDIDAIHAEVPELVYISLVFPEPKTPQEAQFSLPYSLACAALQGEVRLEDLAPAAISSSDKLAVMAKVSVSVSEDLSTDEMRAAAPESARLRITLKNGKVLNGFCAEAYGMPGRPLSNEHLFAKFKRCLNFANISCQQYSFETTDYLHLIRELSKKG
jgi:2-methylcitrate dehydratase PrpD